MALGLTITTLIGAPVLGSVLSTFGLVLLWTLIVVLGGLLVLLVVPIHLRADGGVHGTSLTGQAAIRWGWGLLSVRMSTEAGTTLHLLGIRIWTFQGADEDDQPEKKKAPRKKSRKRKAGLRWFLQYRRQAWLLLERLLGTLRLRLRLSGELGLGDPADTALLAALLGELERCQELVEIRVEPDWLDETIALDGEGRARIWPIHIGLILLGALLRRDTRRMIRAAW